MRVNFCKAILILFTALWVSVAAAKGNDFALPDVNGVSHKLSDYRGKWVVVNYWATWCPPCREEIPDLIRLQAKHANDSFTVLGIDVGESGPKVSAFAQKMGINYPVVLDRDNAVAEKYGIVGIPTSLLVRSDGTVGGYARGIAKKRALLRREGVR